MKKQITRNWWSFALNGLVALLYGILALTLPQGTLIVVARYTGIVILLTGVVFGLISYNRHKNGLKYGIMLLQTITLTLLGILILMYTKETLNFFITLIGIWALITGILQLIALVNISGSLGNKNFFLVNAIISLLFGLLLIINPFAMAKTLVVISGLLALFFGFVMIWFAFSLRELQKTIPHEEV
ncbi:MAG: DUF308 domain-containing protein [Bacteroidales bacterium]|jgi:uncharacterized membrane protein HdeD (DUF308 family)|nr:DUF308 domain-containing protein [Bacteroidales bacterium]HOI32855.1 DUF308 domain-containing protein [Bacteroidales bacterium]